jgi:hypothetical protein
MKGEHLDVRGSTGYVVVAPSVHATGAVYTWVNPDQPIVPVPAWVGPWVASRSGGKAQVAPPTGAAELPAHIQRSENLTTTLDVARSAVLCSPYEAERLRSALSSIPANIDGRTWFSIGAALHDLKWHVEGQDIGLEIWDAWSKTLTGKGPCNGEYRGRLDLEKRWETFARDRTGPRTTIATIYRMAIERGWRDESRPKREEQVANPQRLSDGAIKASPFVWREPSAIPPRAFLYGRHLVRQYISATIGAGGLGKTALLLAECLVMATGRNLLGHDAPTKLRVWYWNGEDPKEEIERRIAAICRLYGIKSEDIGDRLFVDSGRDTEIKIARDERSGFSIAVPTVEAIKQTIIENRIDVMIVDPFVSSHAVTENDNTRIDAVAKAWGRIAGETNCGIDLSHHTRKGAHGQFEHAVEDARGAKALIDAARSVRVLNQMSEEEARNFGIGPPSNNQRRRYFRVDNGKANLALPPDNADWYFIESVCLGNGGMGLASGDNVGVVATWTPPDPLQLINEVDLPTIIERVATGEYRADAQAKAWVGKVVADVLRLDIEEPSVKAKVKALLKHWIKSGALAVVQKPDKQRVMRDFVVPGLPLAPAAAPPQKGGALHVGQVKHPPAPPPPP